MAESSSAPPPSITAQNDADGRRIRLEGRWTLDASAQLEQQAQQIVDSAAGARLVVLDLSDVARLDTAGAWLINRARQHLAQGDVSVVIEQASVEQDTLLEEAAYRPRPPAPARWSNPIVDLLEELGRTVVAGVREVLNGLAFFGEFVVKLGEMIRRPLTFRLTSLVAQMETIGFRAIPLIVTINLLVGGIVGQQGIVQLRRFGAATYAVDLIGILVLRELGVLLTSIMIAGRSGSAITAEIGSMKMREEIDALRVMGLSPLEVLAAPRIFALIATLPMLTFIGDMSALVGGMLASYFYGGISPEAFWSLMQSVAGLNRFLVGIIKAPFMALVIGLIAVNDGFGVQGSAESLGRQVTASVVKSIFMVILLDGFFAIFFAAIDF